MAVKLTDFVAKRQNTNKFRPSTIVLDCTFKLNGVAYCGEAWLQPDDGSIKECIGCHYASLDCAPGAKKVKEDWRARLYDWDCPKCATECSALLFDALVEYGAQHSLKVVRLFKDSGFSFRIPLCVAGWQSAGWRSAGPEVAVIYLKNKARCPVHGVVTVEDTDVAD